MADVRAPTAKRTAPPLSGALGTVSLPDVLQLLELGRRSGVLAVDGGDGRRGVVHLADGAIARAHYRDARPRGGAAATAPAVDELTAAVGALVALRAGRFTFTPAANPPAPGPRARVEAVLLAALHAADESAHRQTRGAVDATPGEPTAVTHPEPRRIPVLAPTRADVPGPQAARPPLGRPRRRGRGARPAWRGGRVWARPGRRARRARRAGDGGHGGVPVSTGPRAHPGDAGGVPRAPVRSSVCYAPAPAPSRAAR
jgi:hypothetical protein